MTDSEYQAIATTTASTRLLTSSYTPQSSDEIAIFTAATGAQEHNREDISCGATAVFRKGGEG